MHSSTVISTLALAAGAAATGVWTTPHDSYSSSVGVLGCKINTDRVAYWPGNVDCNNICIKLSYEGRSVHLLRIDQSGGAFDISYDAWNYLQTGESAAVNPITGGTVPMEYEEVDASECADLIRTPGNKLPLSASNSINYLASCLEQPDSWVAKNHVLYNICDAICTLGHDEECKLDLSVSNQPSCDHTLGLTTPLDGAPVYNILYQSGKTVVAGTGEEVSPQAQTPGDVATEQPAPEEPAPAPTLATLATPAGGVFQEKTTTTEAAPVEPTPEEYVPSSSVVVVEPVSSTTEYVPSSSSAAAPVPVPSTSTTEYPVAASSSSSSSSVSSTSEDAPLTSATSTTTVAPVAPYPTTAPTHSFAGYNTTISPVQSSKPVGGGEQYTTLIKTTSVNLPASPSAAPTQGTVQSGASILGSSSLLLSAAAIIAMSSLF